MVATRRGTWKSEHVEFLSALGYGTQTNGPATLTDLQTWYALSNQAHDVAIDPSFTQLMPVFDAYKAVPINVIIDTSDMTIMEIALGVQDFALLYDYLP